jgi:hypothetical protein
MRWFLGGVIIGLLVLELKVLGGCGSMAGISRGGAAPGAPSAADPLAAHKCSCAKAASSPIAESIAPAQPKVFVSSPSHYRNVIGEL